MTSRFLISMLCVGAVAFACGPRPRNEAAVTSKTSLATAQDATVRQQGTERAPRQTTTRADVKSPVTAEFYVRATPESIRFALHVINTTKKRVELTFPTGQTYDFVVLDSLGREVWRWGSGRMFTQALRNRLLSGGETLDLDETWESVTLPPGRYTARAHLTSENYPLVKETQFTVTGTTIASR